MEIGDPLALMDTPSPMRLSRRQKAAIVVRLLLNEGADIPLSSLPEATQAQLTLQMGAMQQVDRTTMENVVREFLDEVEAVGLSFSGGLSGALALLGGTISPATAAKLRREAGVYVDCWDQIAAAGPDRLLPLLESESTQVSAVLLSKLSVELAAALLGKLPGPKARRLAYAMSQTSKVTPEAVARIGQSLLDQLEAEPATAFDEGPVERVGAILNYSPAVTRDDVLEGLTETDAAFAEQVRKAIFTFTNIPERIAPLDIPKVVKDVGGKQLAQALALARQSGDAAAADFVLDNMSKRMADQLREEVDEIGEVKTADGEAAQAEVIAAIRAAQASGEITLTTS